MSMASAKLSASILAKPASGNEEVMNGPLVVWPCARPGPGQASIRDAPLAFCEKRMRTLSLETRNDRFGGGLLRAMVGRFGTCRRSF
jgi:hypothetical protein